MAQTLYDKIWNEHVVRQYDDGSVLLYVDRHLVHEVTSPQAFEGLRLAGRRVRRPDLTLATVDHNVPTRQRHCVSDPVAAEQIATLERNAKEYGIPFLGLSHPEQGIVHVVGPELGFTLPGTTIVCGDSHTSTHGAFGALAFGIGTSEVEHVLATQTLRLRKSLNFRVRFVGEAGPGVTAKDMILRFIGEVGPAGGTGFVLEFCGDAIRALSMEERMTVCNMSIEAGARAGLIAPDEVTFDYVASDDRPYAPRGRALREAIRRWEKLASDKDAKFDREIELNISDLEPQVTWGTSPGMVTGISGEVPEPEQVKHFSRDDAAKALAYTKLKPGQKIVDIPIDVVFLGSCTNGRLSDLRIAAEILKGKKISPHVRMIVVPGSERIRRRAEKEGLDKIFKEAGAEWRHAGCSMCLAMNEDRLEPGQRCASTTNRNFESRQGRDSITHLVSPATAAASAIAGHLSDPREYFA
ncbi:MAG: 3-isopropylmalate dehydratase large subunit [Verrucomicrobia bacterium]|nr:MAG: 3-isopropylmalate dehydratase large subunit [Verrucomicrobiota bacterium]